LEVACIRKVPISSPNLFQKHHNQLPNINQTQKNGQDNHQRKAQVREYVLSMPFPLQFRSAIVPLADVSQVLSLPASLNERRLLTRPVMLTRLVLLKIPAMNFSSETNLLLQSISRKLRLKRENRSRLQEQREMRSMRRMWDGRRVSTYTLPLS